jgi:hypothetical protein
MQQQRPINYQAEAASIRNKGVHIAIPILMMLYLIVGFAYAFGLSIYLGSGIPFALYFLGFPFGVFVVLRKWMLVTFSGWPNFVAGLYAIIGAIILIASIIPHAGSNVGWIALYAIVGTITWGPIVAIVYFVAKAIGQRKRSVAAAEHAQMVERMEAASDAQREDATPDPNDSAAWGLGPG